MSDRGGKTNQQHGALACFYCGAAADDADEHVPPEVFYRASRTDDPALGASANLKTSRTMPFESSDRAAKTPYSRSNPGDIIRVPSCKAHNTGFSEADDRLAMVIAQCCDVSWAGIELIASRVGLISRVEFGDPKEKARAYALFGMTLQDHEEETHFAGYGTLANAVESVRRAILKIAAGVVFAATGRSVGTAMEGGARVATAALKGFLPVHPRESMVDTAQREAPQHDWSRDLRVSLIESGSPVVFYARLGQGPSWGPSRLLVELVFFQGVKILVMMHPADRR